MRSYWLAKVRDSEKRDYAWFYVEWAEESYVPPDTEIIKWSISRGIYRANSIVQFARLSENGTTSFPLDRMIVSTNLNFWLIGHSSIDNQ